MNKPPKPAGMTCNQTGLRLLGLPTFLCFRVQKTSYGPLRPLRRPCVGVLDDERQEWGRWDVAGSRTIYASETRAGAFAESIYWAQTRLTKAPGFESAKIAGFDVPISDLFDQELEPEAKLEDVVRTEFAKQGFMSLGTIPKSWREGRDTNTLRLPSTGWFIQVDHSDSISAIRAGMPKTLSQLSLDNLTSEHLFSSDRRITTAIAQFLWSRTVFDGSSPLGIVYKSKFGNDYSCYAIWLRSGDDGDPDYSDAPGGEPSKPVGPYPEKIGSQEIVETDRDLWEAAEKLGLSHIF